MKKLLNSHYLRTGVAPLALLVASHTQAQTVPADSSVPATSTAQRAAPDAGSRVRADTAALIERSGFYEAFDPTNGAPTGGDTFSWTAAIWLAWARS